MDNQQLYFSFLFKKKRMKLPSTSKWSQVVSLADSLYDNRRSLKIKQQQVQDDLGVQVSSKQIRVGDLYNHLVIGMRGMKLDGQPIQTSQEKQTAKHLLQRFLSSVQTGPDTLSVLQFSTKHDNMLRHLTVDQLANLRSSHRQMSHVGDEQVELFKSLLGKKWSESLLRRTPIETLRQIGSNEVSHRLLHRFSSWRSVRRVAQQLFSLPEYQDKSYVWAYEKGSNEAEEYYEMLGCVAKCVLQESNHSALLCFRYWKTKSRTRLLPTNVFDLYLFEEGKERPIIHQHAFPLSPYYMNKLLEKVILHETTQFLNGQEVVRVRF